MPTYDYVCRACGHAFEHFQGITEEALRACPRCRKRRLERLIGTGAGVMFKGSGFYETDYKRPAKGAAASDAKDGDGGKQPAEERTTRPAAGADANAPAAPCAPAAASEGGKPSDAGPAASGPSATRPKQPAARTRRGKN